MSDAPRYDVAVIGAGIAGLAASILLRKAGLNVVCLDERAYPHSKVGESLDWSSPGLLRRLGIDVTSLIQHQTATYKKSIVPRGPIGMAVFDVIFAGARAWVGGWLLVARAALWWRGARLDGER